MGGGGGGGGGFRQERDKLPFIIIFYLFCHTTYIMKTKNRKSRLTMARRLKGNYEAYIN